MSIAAHTLFGNTVIADDGLVPVNQDVVSQSIGVDAAGRLDSTLSSKLAAEVTEAYLKGPSQMRDLLDPELDLHGASARRQIAGAIGVRQPSPRRVSTPSQSVEYSDP